MSASTKTGVGLGVPLGVLIMAILAFLLYRYHRRSKPVGDTNNRSVGVDEWNAASEAGIYKPPGQGMTNNMPPLVAEISEADSVPVSSYLRELEGTPGPHRRELPAHNEMASQPH